MIILVLFGISFLTPNLLFADDCEQSFTQWELNQQSLDYISNTAMNHSHHMIRNYNNWSACSTANFAYGTKTSRMPEDSYREARSLRAFGQAKVKDFLKTCRFANNYYGNGRVAERCPTRAKLYTQTVKVEGQNLSMSCQLLEERKKLVIKIGSLTYEFPYNSGSETPDYRSRFQRNLDSTIDLRSPSIVVNRLKFSSCSKNTNYSTNFCIDNPLSLRASSTSLICQTQDNRYNYCIYGRRADHNLKVPKNEACPLNLNRSRDNDSDESTISQGGSSVS